MGRRQWVPRVVDSVQKGLQHTPVDHETVGVVHYTAVDSIFTDRDDAWALCMGVNIDRVMDRRMDKPCFLGNDMVSDRGGHHSISNISSG